MRQLLAARVDFPIPKRRVLRELPIRCKVRPFYHLRCLETNSRAGGDDRGDASFGVHFRVVTVQRLCQVEEGGVEIVVPIDVFPRGVDRHRPTLVDLPFYGVERRSLLFILSNRGWGICSLCAGMCWGGVSYVFEGRVPSLVLGLPFLCSLNRVPACYLGCFPGGSYMKGFG